MPEKSTSPTPAVGQVRRLLRLRRVGVQEFVVVCHGVFGWRKIRNRRELAALAGITPTPYNSGDSKAYLIESISKAGNRQVRGTIVEVAWSWLRYQPDSALSRWYWERFGKGFETSAADRHRGVGESAIEWRCGVTWNTTRCLKEPA